VDQKCFVVQFGSRMLSDPRYSNVVGQYHDKPLGNWKHGLPEKIFGTLKAENLLYQKERFSNNK